MKVGDWIIFENCVGRSLGVVTESRAKSVIAKVSNYYHATVHLNKVLVKGSQSEMEKIFADAKSLEKSKNVSIRQVEENYHNALTTLFAKGQKS